MTVGASSGGGSEKLPIGWIVGGLAIVAYVVNIYGLYRIFNEKPPAIRRGLPTTKSIQVLYQIAGTHPEWME
ncbi:hypothetical protein C922_05616 [Plasmodium inui San Antonio 1]|uniref:Uncharacterized protein n=1 Tax=Plasmodium inui San Antonio 1 TaxID=1237626 RepID=W7A4I7_9APIC|nr:hypothetical protein C922_05616 [Plasmodium inui San Antonio 1]EUD64004.1 hypothetical protein C922_05616 [Plasmodium inui San Antonio 1]